MPEHDLKNAKAFFGATSAGPWSDAGLGAMTLLKRSKKQEPARTHFRFSHRRFSRR